jgi:NitT/TauT family transport system permease protein
MDDRTVRPLPPLRPERELEPEATGTIGDVARPLTFIERLTNTTLVRRLAVIVVLAAAWEIYARILDNPLLFRRSPTHSPRSRIPPRTAC